VLQSPVLYRDAAVVVVVVVVVVDVDRAGKVGSDGKWGRELEMWVVDEILAGIAL